MSRGLRCIVVWQKTGPRRNRTLDLMLGLTAVAKALEIVQGLRKLERTNQDAELKMGLADLTGALADTKLALAAAKSELADKSDALRMIEAQLKAAKEYQLTKYETVNFQGYNFGIGSDGKPFGHPFCPQCEQKEGVQYKLTPIGRQAFKCPSCKYSGHGPIPMLPASLKEVVEN